MKKETNISVFPDNIDNYEKIKLLVSKRLNVDINDISAVRTLKRSIDARGKRPLFKLRVEAYINEQPKEKSNNFEYTPVTSKKNAIIIGSGPAGLFAALRLIELNIKPIIFERGKDVRERRIDLKNIQQDHLVNPDSNYCFGEGGAGTYSDGKLYTRSKKRGDVDKILKVLNVHGAVDDILIDAHPHIGSNKLPKVISSMRETILNCNGEVHFNSKMTDIIVENNVVKGVIINGEKEYLTDVVILATGHSARDVFNLFDERKFLIESKPFAMGVRIEHPQELIDSIQYNSRDRHRNLPAASYNLACQVKERGVYSFCMCPGGIIVPASTDSEELVLNGMSVSRRDSKFANSGLVVSVTEKDYQKYKSKGALAGLAYQMELENACFLAGSKTQKAPAQRITDFLKERQSNDLPESSYIPGTVSAPVNEILPENITQRLKKAIRMFDSRMRGYLTSEAQILAPESRTSSPIRIPRDSKTREHIEINGLFPCGEGAGYAGGIVSAAIDGEKSAEAVSKFLN